MSRTTPQTFDILQIGKRLEERRRRRRAADTLLGLLLLGLPLARRTPLGIGVGVLGGALLVRGLTGKKLGELAREIPRRIRDGRSNREIDEALVQTFPASDPPAF